MLNVSDRNREILEKLLTYKDVVMLDSLHLKIHVALPLKDCEESNVAVKEFYITGIKQLDIENKVSIVLEVTDTNIVSEKLIQKVSDLRSDYINILHSLKGHTHVPDIHVIGVYQENISITGLDVTKPLVTTSLELTNLYKTSYSTLDSNKKDLILIAKQHKALDISELKPFIQYNVDYRVSNNDATNFELVANICSRENTESNLIMGDCYTEMLPPLLLTYIDEVESYAHKYYETEDVYLLVTSEEGYASSIIVVEEKETNDYNELTFRLLTENHFTLVNQKVQPALESYAHYLEETLDREKRGTRGETISEGATNNIVLSISDGLMVQEMITNLETTAIEKAYQKEIDTLLSNYYSLTTEEKENLIQLSKMIKYTKDKKVL